MGRALDLRWTGCGFISYSGQKLRNNLGQIVQCSHLCASITKQYNFVPAKGQWCSVAVKVTAGLAESNGSLLLVGWLIVTCGLTACTPGIAPGPMLGNEYGKPLLFCTQESWCCCYWVNTAAESVRLVCSEISELYWQAIVICCALVCVIISVVSGPQSWCRSC